MIRYCGRDFTPTEITQIRALIKNNPPVQPNATFNRGVPDSPMVQTRWKNQRYVVPCCYAEDGKGWRDMPAAIYSKNKA